MSTNPMVLSLASLNGQNGFRIPGLDLEDFSGSSVASAGDVNGDGFDDFLIGAPGGDPLIYADAGETYVVFGKSTAFPAVFDLATLNGANGFVIGGIAPSDFSGSSVSSAGDVNGDGFDDILIGATRLSGISESYVVFGKASGFSLFLDLFQLNGTNGFMLTGGGGNYNGWLTSAGDVNGDGFDDIAIGNPSGYANYGDNAGHTYIVFGKASGFGSSFNLATLNGSNGFRVEGIDGGDYSGRFVSGAGDINGDGFDDVIIGSDDGDRDETGQAEDAYLIFGKASGFSGVLQLSALNGANGFRIDGITAPNLSGISVANAGDVNNDGFDDILVGADTAGATGAGQSYLIFGKAAGFGAVLDITTLNGVNGFRIDGVAAGDFSGKHVASAGDVNGDGFADILIGAYGADPGGFSAAGSTYVVFGKATGFGSSINLSTLNGDNGFRIDGFAGGIRSGKAAASAGDINGDGFDDIVMDASYASPGGDAMAGESYIIYGRATATVTRTGTVNADRLFGGDYNDVLRGGGGADELHGRNGSDFASYYFDTAVHTSLDGSVAQLGAASGDTYSSIENLSGSNIGNDTLAGDGGSNKLNGNGGNDTLQGRDGADILKGGLGNDMLSGNAGADQFVFDTALNALTNVDTISTVSTLDRIVLDNDIFTALGTSFTSSEFRAINTGTSFSSVDASDNIIYLKSTGQLFYDRDGSGTAYARVLFANLTDNTLLNFGQILMIE